MGREMTVGIAGAAGDGLDRSGDTLARTAARLGLHVFTYNSYQSLIRGGHTWLRLRISESEVTNHGDDLDLLIALNQDSIERHAPEVGAGGAILFNSDKVACDPALVPEGVTVLPLPIKEITEGLGKLLPVMQNTVALGALLHLTGVEADVTADILTETFKHKGDDIIRQNVSLLRAGHDYAQKQSKPLGYDWNFTRRKRAVVTGNQMIAMGAVAAGCRFYSAYPMSPASSILHWLASRSEKLGVLVKQAEDELAVVNIAIGAGHAGARAMCATSGGGFALMTEAIGMAAIMEIPVVIVNVMRGGPSTGLPTKTEQGDLNQAVGASQGDYPRVILAPKDAVDCYELTAEAFNIAEAFQLPVILLSDLLLAEQRITLDPKAVSPDVEIDRGAWATEAPDGPFRRYAMTRDGVSPRARPGTEGFIHVAATDDHDETGVLISDEHTNAAIRRKMHEKRMKKMDGVAARLAPPALEGPGDADVTLVGWGSTHGVIAEAVARLADGGVSASQLHFNVIHPFPEKEARRILEGCRRTIAVESNYDGQFARHLRAETGFTVHDIVTRYDGEPFDPAFIVERVQGLIEGRPHDLAVAEHEAREMAYHFIRVRLGDKGRPTRLAQGRRDGCDEPVWNVDIVDRAEGTPRGTLVIGTDTGALHAWEEASA